MRKMWKQVTIVMMMIMSVFAFKLDVSAEKIWNTSGEKNPWGGDYDYKFWTGSSWAYCGDGTIKEEDFIDISYDVTYDYEEAYKMLEYVNEARREAGVPELIMKDELMDVAMQRAAETVIHWEHGRPDGSSIGSLSMYVGGENIYWGSSNAEVATKKLINSPGHYETMIDDIYTYVGFGCVDGRWVQIFSRDDLYYEDGYDAAWHYEHDVYEGRKLVYSPKSPNDKPVQWDKMTSGNRKNYTETFTATINPEMYWLEISMHTGEWFVDSILEPTIYLMSNNCKYGPMGFGVPVSEYNISCDDHLKKVEDGIKCTKSGTATIKACLKDCADLKAEFSFDIKKNSFKVNGNTYRITDFSNAEAELVKASKTKKKITIPQYIKCEGRAGSDDYKITSIASNAFKNNKKVVSVTVGKNVKTIGTNAFRGCKNLKKITVKSTKLESVGKDSLKGIHKKAIIKVPASKLEKYKALFKSKGQKKTVKVKK